MIHIENTQNLDVYVWDVGHGLSVTCVTPYVPYANGGIPIQRRRVIQIDAGNNSQYNFSPVKHLTENRGLKIIDCLVISHVDQDHIADLADIDDLRRAGNLTIKTLLRNSTYPTALISADQTEETRPKTVYRELHSSYTSPAYDPDILTSMNFGGVSVVACYLDYREGLESNSCSVVTSVTFGNTQIIIPGDIEGDAVLELKALNKLPGRIGENRILIAPHHGRESADSSALLEHFAPKVVLASAMEEDEFTDGLFSSSQHISGHPIIYANGNSNQHKFMATKGEAFHINVNPSLNYFPLIKRVPYRNKTQAGTSFSDLIQQVLRNSAGY